MAASDIVQNLKALFFWQKCAAIEKFYFFEYLSVSFLKEKFLPAVIWS